MSYKIGGMVWDLDLPHNEMLVLLAMADHADHDGANIFPRYDFIAWKTGYTRRQIIHIVKRLTEQGILVKDGTKSGGVNVFHINLDAAPQKQDFKEWHKAHGKSAENARAGGEEISPLGVKKFHPGGEEISPPQALLNGQGARTPKGVNSACVSDETHARAASPDSGDAPQDGASPSEAPASETPEFFAPQGNAPAPQVSPGNRASATARPIPPTPGGPPLPAPIPRAADAVRKRAEEIFVALSGIPSPTPTDNTKKRNATAAAWWQPLREMLSVCGDDLARFEKLMGRTVKHMAENHLTLSDPRGAQKVFTSMLGEENRKARPAARAKEPVLVSNDTPTDVLRDIVSNPHRYAISLGSIDPTLLLAQRYDGETQRNLAKHLGHARESARL